VSRGIRSEHRSDPATVLESVPPSFPSAKHRAAVKQILPKILCAVRRSAGGRPAEIHRAHADLSDAVVTEGHHEMTTTHTGDVMTNTNIRTQVGRNRSRRRHHTGRRWYRNHQRSNIVGREADLQTNRTLPPGRSPSTTRSGRPTVRPARASRVVHTVGLGHSRRLQSAVWHHGALAQRHRTRCDRGNVPHDLSRHRHTTACVELEPDPWAATDAQCRQRRPRRRR